MVASFFSLLAYFVYLLFSFVNSFFFLFILQLKHKHTHPSDERLST